MNKAKSVIIKAQVSIRERNADLSISKEIPQKEIYILCMVFISNITTIFLCMKIFLINNISEDKAV